MERIRAVGIVIRNNEVLLMYRRKYGQEFFAFPGGGVDKGETVEQAVLRELMEETTVEAKINKLLYRHIYDNNTEQFFYLCDYIEGEPKLGESSEEKEKTIKGDNFYNPLWVKIEELKNMLVYPLEIRDILIKDFKNNFIDDVKTFTIKASELRQQI